MHRAKEQAHAQEPSTTQSGVAAPVASDRRTIHIRLALGLMIIALLAAAYLWLSESGALDILLNGAELRERIAGLGWLGPLGVIGLMTVAIVINPLPSAPIAMAAGALYGHIWGTLYIVLGAELGALIAFGIARLLGSEFIPKLWQGKSALPLLGSQNALMVIVFVSRLIPFISFDLMSYAAGLTPLSAWRFALATLAGILPASFLLAHFGAGLVSAEIERVTITVLALGLLTAIPILGRMIWTKVRARSLHRNQD